MVNTPKTIPEKIQRILKKKRLTMKQAMKILQEHNFNVSVGWLSAHKIQWQPDIDAIMTSPFDEHDKTLDTDLARRLMLFKNIKIRGMSDKKHFSIDILKRFCTRSADACESFSKECLVFRGKPIILQSHQKRMIRGWLGKKNTVYAIGRGGAKDFTLAIFLIWYCSVFPNTRVVIICPAYRQVRTFVHENLALMMQTSSELYDSMERFTDEEFFFTNGSQIFTYGATSYIKGKHNVNFIFANEAGEISEHVFENVLLPMLGTADTTGHFGIMGVPEGQQGYFWKAFQNSSIHSSDQEYPFLKIHLPTSVNKYFSKKQLAENRRIMSNDTYLQEHEARFLDISDALFSSRIIEIMKEEYDTQYGIVNRKREYYLGIDWGRSADSSVFTIIEKNPSSEEYRIAFIKQSKQPLTKQHKWLVETDMIYNFKNIMSEYMGLGIGPSERLREAIGHRVKYFIPSAKSWLEAFRILRDECEKETVTVPAGALKLLAQLRLLSFKMRGNNLTVRSEGKDDYAQSFCIAFQAACTRSGVGIGGALKTESEIMDLARKETRKSDGTKFEDIFVRDPRTRMLLSDPV